MSWLKAQPDSLPVTQTKSLTHLNRLINTQEVRLGEQNTNITNYGGDKCRTNSHERRNYLWRNLAVSK